MRLPDGRTSGGLRGVRGIATRHGTGSADLLARKEEEVPSPGDSARRGSARCRLVGRSVTPARRRGSASRGTRPSPIAPSAPRVHSSSGCAVATAPVSRPRPEACRRTADSTSHPVAIVNQIPMVHEEAHVGHREVPRDLGHPALVARPPGRAPSRPSSTPNKTPSCPLVSSAAAGVPSSQSHPNHRVSPTIGCPRYPAGLPNESPRMGGLDGVLHPACGPGASWAVAPIETPGPSSTTSSAGGESWDVH